MFGLYANRNAHRDFVGDALRQLADPPGQVYLAVAFFTDPSIVEQLVRGGSNVRLVVRLGYPTAPNAIERILGKTGVEVRFFTDRAFHPKLYVFGTRIAVVGSANLTQSALLTNQEVCVTIPADDPRFDGLVDLFGEYWSQANVLTTDVLEKYRNIFNKYRRLGLDEEKQIDDVLSTLGRVVAGNITRDVTRDTTENIFLEGFRKAYQEFVTAFNAVRSVYQQVGKRKISEAKIPLRLEIDSFFSYVRGEHARGEQWAEAPLLSGGQQQEKITALVAEWIDADYPWFTDTIVNENYPRLLRVFGSKASILSTPYPDLFDALTTIHAVYDRLRFYSGGMPTWKKAFLEGNQESRVRETFAYLLYGGGAIEERMANAIYDSKYKLSQFGRSGVQELVGWLNREDLPVVNSRTTKVLRYFGFDVMQLN